MNLVSLVLAAGSGTRFGGKKLAAKFNGEPLIAHALRAARTAPVSRVIAVCRPAQAIGDWPGEPPVEVRYIESTELSASLKAGIAAAGQCDGAFVFLGDMPLVPHDIAGQLAALLGGNFAALPRCGGRNGHPVLLSARAFPAIAKLRGDEGAGRLLQTRNDVAFLNIEDEGVLFDVDRAEDIARLEQLGRA